MNEQTEKLLSELAEKLGTTAEYLWEVLVKQAPVAGIGEVLSLVAGFVTLSVISFVFLKLYKKYTEGSSYSIGDGDVFVGMITFLVGMVWVAFFFISINSITNIITCFTNPEYWALKQILP